MGGRIVDLAGYDRDTRIFYITTRVVFDREGSVSLGDAAVCQSNPDIVWAGAGEGSSRNSTAWRAGVYKSVDGGKTWAQMGLVETPHITRIIIDPRNPDVIYVGALGRLWGPNPDRGVYKTTDGGKSWLQVLRVDQHTGVADLVMDPKNPDHRKGGWKGSRILRAS